MARQYQVPQFIEVEDKLFGPLTFKQFAFLVGGAGLGYVIFRLMPNFILGVSAAAPVVILALALAFYKVHDRPFPLVLEAAMRYFFGTKLYLWKKEDVKKPQQVVQTKNIPAGIPRISESKLKDLSWSLGVNKEDGRGTL